MPRNRPARVSDVHRIAGGMPYVTCEDGRIYQVGGKSFVFFRTPRRDAVDPETGERYDDVIVIWVASEQDKRATLAAGDPWFTTDHFEGHRSVLVRASRLGELMLEELQEAIQDAWLAQASWRRGQEWLRANGFGPAPR